jgi:hypothetical protein
MINVKNGYVFENNRLECYLHRDTRTTIIISDLQQVNGVSNKVTTSTLTFKADRNIPGLEKEDITLSLASVEITHLAYAN